VKVSPKKYLGQHFLKDLNIAQKIVEHLNAIHGNVIEVGPGTGILTKILLQKNFKEFRIIEIDNESIAFLRNELPDITEQIIHADFLRINLHDLFPGKFCVIGNFPYNISSQILFKVLEAEDLVDEVVGMFQKEVAERIVSPPGSKKYGILSVLIQAYYQPEFLFTVSEQVFHPPPKVKSAVIRLSRLDNDKLNCKKDTFFKIVKAAFNQRRKILKNALSSFEFIKTEELQILLSKRAEQLSVSEFEYLCKNLK